VKKKFDSLGIVARSKATGARLSVGAAAAGVLAAGLLAALPASAQVATATDSRGEYVRGRVLVGVRAGLADAELGKIVGAQGGRARAIGRAGLFIVDLPPNASETAVAQRLANNPQLKFAELDRRVPRTLVANDPYLGSQWHTAKVNAASAWDISQGAGVVIAILDSGVDAAHPDLSSRIVPGWNVWDNNSNTSDVHGHGTAVAGTAAATMNNAMGVAGIAGQAKIMPVRIADSSGYATFSSIAQGITYAADHGARVASISFKNLPTSSTVQSAAQYMKGKGGLVVVSAGNDAINENFTPTTTMIPVSATDSSDKLTSFSSYGAYVAMSAPGIDIWTTNRGGGYGAWWGTSFATPNTAGTIALIMGANPSLTSSQVESVLYSSATDLGAPGRDIYFGYGRINTAAAVQAAKGSSAPPPDSTAPTVAVSAPLAGSTVSGLVAVSVNAGDNLGVTKVELRANGALVATDTASPFGFSWDSSSVANGAVTLTATAYDAAGNVSSSTVSVNVSNAPTVVAPDTTPPSVKIVSPTSGAVAGRVTISSSATDDRGSGGITQSLYIDGVLKATVTGGSLSFNWNTRKVAAGSHTIQVVARDAAQNAAASSVSVTK
jgi:subtilisin family serine protease